MNLVPHAEPAAGGWQRLILLAGLLSLGPAAEPCRGDSPGEVPVAPLPAADIAADLPRDHTLDPAVQPAAVAAPAQHLQPSSRPVSLLGENAEPVASRPLQPAANWSVLAAIVGAFAVLGLFRFRSGRRLRTLPPEIFDVLGEGSLGGQHAVRVVRFGPRTLLVGISPSGSQTLAEIDDPALTERFAAACIQRSAPRPFSAARPAQPRGGAADEEAA